VVFISKSSPGHLTLTLNTCQLDDLYKKQKLSSFKHELKAQRESLYHPFTLDIAVAPAWDTFPCNLHYLKLGWFSKKYLKH
jgi:hypothetical protein